MFHQVGAFVKSLFINWSFEVYALIDAEDATVPEDSKKLLKGYSVAFRKPGFFFIFETSKYVSSQLAWFYCPSFSPSISIIFQLQQCNALHHNHFELWQLRTH